MAFTSAYCLRCKWNEQDGAKKKDRKCTNPNIRASLTSTLRMVEASLGERQMGMDSALPSNQIAELMIAVWPKMGPKGPQECLYHEEEK